MVTASENLCRAKRFAYSHIPELFFIVTISKLPDERFGIGDKSVDEIKRNYKL